MRENDQMETKRVLITGAAGTIGSALVKRFISIGSTVCALDNNEDGLFRLRNLYDDHVSSGRLRIFIGDIRDQDRLQMAFDKVDIVIHAAALKHVELSEMNVLDCIATNVEGVKNVVKAAIDNNVERVLFTSSDKAVNPSSTMGATKLLGERIVSAANNLRGGNKTVLSSVRFGNVLESNGSVLTIFKKCIEQNEPFPITDLSMTRFFLTINDAVDLCLHGIYNMKGGEVFVKTMGTASIYKLAQAVSGNENITYKIIGLKPGEKTFEELVTDTESARTFLKDGYFTIFPEFISENDRRARPTNEPGAQLNCALSSVSDELTWKELKTLIGKIK